ncbi:PAS domain-containing protein [Parapedobacter sp. ISTM3]|uniref:PAS domain-containing protein n=1 Tax=Parapedobacter sp. ISTM3 TaxID=2800130 RepID=UPI001907135D|nr:PAS domain-containing protein [Parapedobacter sp. ISTM3]MBK1442688.1 PAS domain-containing protein [Parapedobacter sp. ISTM3]
MQAKLPKRPLRKDGNEHIPDYRFHLEMSQKMAKIGSWELDLSVGNPDAPQYWSDETYRILGYEPGEITPSFNTFINSVHPDDRPMVMAAAQRSIKEGADYDLEQRHILPDGRIITTRSIAQVIRENKTGTPLKLCGAMKDITEQKETNSALERAHKEMATFFQKIDEVLYSVDMQQYKILQMSPACEKVYGYTVDEFHKNNYLWMDVILEEDKHIIRAGDPVMRRGEIVANEYRIHHKDGSIRWLGGTLTPTLDENGNLIRIDGVVSDITIRKEAELAVKNSEQKFRTLIENSSDGIAVTNLDRQLLFSSSAMHRITGYTPDELHHVDMVCLFHPDDRRTLLSIQNKILEAPGTTEKFIARFRRKEGNWIWLEGVSQNLLAEPAVKGIVTNFRDITERITYEEALKSANTHLKKTNNELDRFVYSVSHDLRAPLASILGLIEFTESETRDADVVENLSMMKDSVKKLDGFILDILDYSRNSRSEIKIEKINFSKMLDAVISNLKFMSREDGNVAIRVNVDKNQHFYSDSSRLQIILNNLISNAIRYYNPDADAPYVEVTINTEPTEATICVKDNGIGIDNEFQSKIFDMFYRVSKKSVGSGLGLYIVKETIEKLNGTLELYSEPGIGTAFTLKIPNLNQS